MKNFTKNLRGAFEEDRGAVILMGLVFLFGLVLLVFSLLKLNLSGAMVKVGYSDLGGYRDGNWTEMLAFPIVAVILGIFHNLLALRIYEKRGIGMMKFFLITTAVLIVEIFVVLFKN